MILATPAAVRRHTRIHDKPEVTENIIPDDESDEEDDDDDEEEEEAKKGVPCSHEGTVDHV